MFEKKLENFDQYRVFNDFRVVYCEKCGFLLNDTNYTQEELNRFYTVESPYSAVSAHGAGGSSDIDTQVYERYLSIVEPMLSKKSRICDIGCAKGGFLNFLAKNGYENLYGVEISPKLVEISRLSGLNVKIGSAEHIPLTTDKEKYDCLFFTNIFEHLFDLSKVLLSINNSLADNGYVFVEVPDCENYSNVEFYPYYHLLNPREHINHFSAYHLSLLMRGAGFNCVYMGQDVFKLNNSRYGSNPVLIMVFTRHLTPPPPPHAGKMHVGSCATHMNKYIAKSDIKIRDISAIIAQYNETRKPVYIWGISSDFFITATFTDLSKCNILGLIDKNVDKQHLSYKNMKILPLDALKRINVDDTVFIFSVYNNDAMKKYLDDLTMECTVIDVTTVFK
ncbi:MAG: class I SAM-dependent methyltransferase [Treponema sp.]|nr:class I SAM-dependent methyltransferase [Treponema sp.]